MVVDGGYAAAFCIKFKFSDVKMKIGLEHRGDIPEIQSLVYVGLGSHSKFYIYLTLYHLAFCRKDKLIFFVNKFRKRIRPLSSTDGDTHIFDMHAKTAIYCHILCILCILCSFDLQALRFFVLLPSFTLKCDAKFTS